MSRELRMLMAIVLSFLIFFLYQVMFVKEVPLESRDPAQEVGKQTPATDEDVKVLDEQAEKVEVDITKPVRQGRTITVSTPLYIAEFTENGGALKSFRLKDYKESVAPGSPMEQIVQLEDEDATTLGVSFLRDSVKGLKEAVFDAAIDTDCMDVTKEQKGLLFEWTSSDGVMIVKTYTFMPDSYEIGIDIKVRNLSGKAIDDNLTISLENSVEEGDESRYVFTGPAAMIDGNLEEMKVKKAGEQEEFVGHIKWIAYESRYFVSAIIPQKASEGTMRLWKTGKDVIESTYIDPSGPVPSRAERTYGYRAYFGPKSLKSLSLVGADLEKIVDFGWFDIIAKPLLHAMKFLYRFIPNYGVVIIIITIIVKILFWPLSNKSYQSMSQMKKLQPKMAELRAKYKHDKKLMNQEIMSLYKLYKVNPLGGCLPMVFQIPVFFAFYKMLYQAIELRHAPFFLWINDLSAPSRLFSFDFKIPMMAPPYGIPVLTIIMGASMFLQQKMSPPPGDPTQAKMMMFMPIFFTVIFINFPSGLVLYWLVNNILSMAQQYYVTKKTS